MTGAKKNTKKPGANRRAWAGPKRSEGARALAVIAVMGTVVGCRSPHLLEQARISYDAQAQGEADAGGFTLDPSTGALTAAQPPPPGSDEAVILDARRLIATERFDRAEALLTGFIERTERLGSAWLPDAVLLRGDARLGDGREYDALYDYERVITEFPDSAAFTDAIEREMEIATAYVKGLRRRFLGLRIEGGRLLGEELLIRVQERMPESVMAEEAAIRLADHYFERRDLPLAAEMYGIFARNHPQSEHVARARSREIFSNVAGFKGPRYDASVLIEAGQLIDRYQARYPAEAERAGVTVGLEARIDESAAATRLETARFYFRRGDEPSARFMLERVVREHPRTTAAQVALRTLEERGWLEVDRPTAQTTPAQTTPAQTTATGAAEAPNPGGGR